MCVRVSALCCSVPELLGCAIPLRTFSLAYPETTEDFPWKHRVFKVRGKIFVFLHGDTKTNTVGLGVKLPQSGLHGSVTARLRSSLRPPAVQSETVQVGAEAVAMQCWFDSAVQLAVTVPAVVPVACRCWN